MTKEEAMRWGERLTPEERANILIEHHTLKQHLCAQRLGVPTGADDWVMRAVRRAEHLRECEHSLRQMIHGGIKLIEEAAWRTNIRQCTNCMGTKKIGGESCCVCHGTGAATY